jgi:nucleoid-associated protein YgaU
MNFRIFRIFAVLMVLGIMVGCASTPTEGPSDAQSEAAAAIAKAKELQSEVNALGYGWRDTDKLIKEAETAYAADDFATATSKANKAIAQAEDALDQYYLQQAKFKLEKYEGMQGLTDEQAAMLANAKDLYLAGKGRAAYDAIMEFEASLAASRIMYTVMKGDNLWNISAKDTIYGNPYHWPLIYKANADQINDPDLIFPGQEFGINRTHSDDEVAKAVSHAKNRGAWAVGTVEDSDVNYLGQ